MTVTKYRADILTDERLERVAEIAHTIADDFEAEIKNVDGGTDHVHILFRYQNNECLVSEYHADINAAVNIADRHDPWGESLPLKPAGDNISRDGSACDSATTHRETSEKPS